MPYTNWVTVGSSEYELPSDGHSRRTAKYDPSTRQIGLVASKRNGLVKALE